MSNLTPRQEKAIEQFPVGEWVKSPFWIHASTLSSLIKRGLLRHEPDPNLPLVITGGRTIWYQHLKDGTFCRRK